MVTKTSNVRYLALFLSLTFLALFLQFAVPTIRAQDQTGRLTVVGMVKVNGQPAATGEIVSSGSTLETAKASSAVVSLGKLGRVEALPETRMKLRYDDTSISILLGAGKVRVSTGPGVGATIATRDE